jgi:hypothetical protein
MKKHLLGLTLVAAMLFMIPASVQASQVETIGVEQDDDTRNDIQITVNKSVVRVTGAEGQVMEVISLTGRHVMSVRIESPAQKVELTNIPKGCYIIKVGKVVRKIVI